MSDLRAVAYVRSRGACEHCGMPLDTGWDLHHRLAGGMGGVSRLDRDVPSNVLALRSDHHNLHPLSVHMTARASRDAGWLISGHDRRPPAAVPVRLWGGGPVLLDDAGGWRVAPRAAV